MWRTLYGLPGRARRQVARDLDADPYLPYVLVLAAVLAGFWFWHSIPNFATRDERDRLFDALVVYGRVVEDPGLASLWAALAWWRAPIGATRDLRARRAAGADAERGTVMPGFTHLQPAQPTTVAHWALSYEQSVARDTARLLDAYDRTNRSPLGAAAFAGTPFDVDRERVAALLGFDGVMENAMDAVSARDFLLETTAALATHATTLSSLAEDVVVYANRGFVELDDDYASTSSIMPQKKNPDTLELVRARTGDATAGLTGLLTVLKGLPRAYNRDLQRAHDHAFAAADAVPAATEVAAGAVATAEWSDDELSEAAGEGFATATGVADLLAMAGIPFRTAHEVVASAADGVADGDDAVDAVADAVEAVLEEPLESYVDPDDLAAALDPTGSVASRDSAGGPAPAAVTDQVEAARGALAADRRERDRRREALDAAAATLATEVDDRV
jgi:argininosuccinate lyase